MPELTGPVRDGQRRHARPPGGDRRAAAARPVSPRELGAEDPAHRVGHQRGLLGAGAPRCATCRCSARPVVRSPLRARGDGGRDGDDPAAHGARRRRAAGDRVRDQRARARHVRVLAAGRLARRPHRPAAGHGRAAVLLVSLVLCGLAPEGSSWQIFVGLFLLGLGWSFATVAASTMIADHASRADVQGAADLVHGPPRVGRRRARPRGWAVLARGRRWPCWASPAPRRSPRCWREAAVVIGGPSSRREPRSRRRSAPRPVVGRPPVVPPPPAAPRAPPTDQLPQRLGAALARRAGAPPVRGGGLRPRSAGRVVVPDQLVDRTPTDFVETGACHVPPTPPAPALGGARRRRPGAWHDGGREGRGSRPAPSRSTTRPGLVVVNMTHRGPRQPVLRRIALVTTWTPGRGAG